MRSSSKRGLNSSNYIHTSNNIHIYKRKCPLLKCNRVKVELTYLNKVYTVFCSLHKPADADADADAVCLYHSSFFFFFGTDLSSDSELLLELSASLLLSVSSLRFSGDFLASLST